MPKILVVDDEADICELLAMQLVHDGYEVITANSGNEALSILSVNAVDLILSDIRMPDGDGVSLLKTMRENGIQTPLIFLSGFADISESEAIRLGATSMVSKPFDRKELKKNISSVFGQVVT